MMDCLETTAESLLSDGVYRQYIRTALGRPLFTNPFFIASVNNSPLELDVTVLVHYTSLRRALGARRA